MKSQQKRVILIIDDCTEDRESYRRYLYKDSSYTYDIVEAETGEEALELLTHHLVDAIILDYMLPDFDGLEFLEELRVNLSDIPPVVMLTGTGNEVIAVEALKSGIRDYLVKGDTTATSLQIALDSAIQQVKWQQQLKKSEERFHASVETMLDCFGIYTTVRGKNHQIIDFQTDYINQAACQDNLLNKNFSTDPKNCHLSPYNLKNELFADCCYVVETGQFLCKEVSQCFQLPSGETTVKIYDVRLSRLGDGFVGIWRDITERKQAEKALYKSEERFRVLVNNAPVGIFQTDAKGDCLFINPRLQEMMGLTEAEAMGYGWVSGLHPEDKQHICSVWYEAARTDKPFASEYRFLTPQGQVVWVFGRAVGLYDEIGQCTGYFGTVTDITERKKSEFLLAQQRDKLLKVNENLLKTTSLLQKRNKELDEFAYIISHDLKAPLRGVRSLSEWIEEDLEGKLEPDTQQQMNLLRQRVERMENLIDGVLQYSRAGRAATPLKNISVKALLESIIDSLEIPPEFTIEIAENLPQLDIQAIFLEQVFTNLITNAVKHHHRPDGTVKITATHQEKGYEFAVKDDGPGIAAQDQERIFKIFQTLKTTKNTDSTGIGLAIVKKIIDQLGGTLRVESELDQGTIFYFTLSSTKA
ncbi:MAG: ATP-binding protein [Microcoleaceae cyanobacterium]